MAPCWDVVVIGAGPAGLATALMVRRLTPRSVLVLDAGPARRERFGESTVPEIQLPLQRLGLLARFQQGPHRPYPGNLSIWAGERPGTNDAIYSPYGPPWRLERAAFDAMLAEEAVAAGAELHWQSRCQASETLAEGFRLQVAGGKLKGPLLARWVVEASGPSARFAAAQGAVRQQHDKLFALARTSAFAGPEPTWQMLLEAVDDGWFYAAQLPGKRIIELFVGEAQTVAAYREQDQRGFVQALAATRLIAEKFAGLARREQRYQATAILSGALDRVCGPAWLACGDAAASYDPIVARGLTKALEDGIAAAALIANQLSAEQYQARHSARFEHYQTVRAELYNQVTRPSPFWSARRKTKIAPEA